MAHSSALREGIQEGLYRDGQCLRGVMDTSAPGGVTHAFCFPSQSRRPCGSMQAVRQTQPQELHVPGLTRIPSGEAML